MELAAALFEGVLSLLDSYHLSVAMDDLDKLVTLLVATAAVSYTHLTLPTILRV